LAELVTDQAKKVRVLLHIAEQLREQATEETEWHELLLRAGEVARTIQNRSEQAEALRELGTALAQAQQWTEAERVIGTITHSSWQAEALRELGTAMASADELDQLLHLIQRSWRQVETIEEALTLFSIASAVISRKPKVGIPFFDAFTWVDTFLGGGD
jgi:hypothetical protein